ncbi:MAG: hypothetical protein GF401_14030 [Chitinivibrionales bacterium]|nr:hypothetical protein [Chitinivibrionales bacterium]
MIKDDGVFPNNDKLPLIIYIGAIELSSSDPSDTIRALFQTNGWENSWVDGIYSFDHYHSNTHEVLGIARGNATVLLGGPRSGITAPVGAGDVILIPAGVAHKKVESTRDFTVVGAYPKGDDFDMFYGKKEERPRADKRIHDVSLPPNDPVYGDSGPVFEQWLHS